MKKIMLLMVSISMPALASEVVIDDAVRNNFGIVTVTVNTTMVTQRWPATATVLDAASLIAAIADLRAAQAASAASASEFKRSQALHQDDNGVALKVVEAANAQAMADRSKVQSLRAQMQSNWGSALGRMSDAALDALMQRLLKGAVLVRAEVAGAASTLKPTTATLYVEAEPPLSGTVFGGLPMSAEQSVGRAYLLSVATKSLDLQPGQVLRAELHDAANKLAGIEVPRSALVRWQGQHWVYVQHAVGHYERVAVHVLQWTERGALIDRGLNAGNQVVTVGAGLLLGAEHAPAKEDAAAVDKD